MAAEPTRKSSTLKKRKTLDESRSDRALAMVGNNFLRMHRVSFPLGFYRMEERTRRSSSTLLFCLHTRLLPLGPTTVCCTMSGSRTMLSSNTPRGPMIATRFWGQLAPQCSPKSRELRSEQRCDQAGSHHVCGSPPTHCTIRHESAPLSTWR